MFCPSVTCAVINCLVMSVFFKKKISLVQVLEEKIFFIFSESYQSRINLSDIYVTHYVKISSSQNALKSVANQDLPKAGSTSQKGSPIPKYTNFKLSK